MLAVEAALISFGINVASAIFVAGAGRLGRAALGEEQERDLRRAFVKASAAMLGELVRGDAESEGLLGHYEDLFREFFGDAWVAETLVGVALEQDAPPLELLEVRFLGMGFDPGTLTMGLDRAMAVFVGELLAQLEDDASAGAPLAALVNREDLKAIRRSVEEIARGLGAPGRDVDELEQESLARCAERWVSAGLSPGQARALAADPGVGAPGPGLRAEFGSSKLAVVVGEVGSGKSLLLDRLLQRAIVRLREESGAPLPVYLEGWEVGGRLRDSVAEKTRSLAEGCGDARTRGAYVLLDGAEEEGPAKAERLVKEARILADTWRPNTTVIVASRPLPELVEDRERVGMPRLRAVADQGKGGSRMASVHDVNAEIRPLSACRPGRYAQVVAVGIGDPEVELRRMGERRSSESEFSVWPAAPSELRIRTTGGASACLRAGSSWRWASRGVSGRALRTVIVSLVIRRASHAGNDEGPLKPDRRSFLQPGSVRPRDA
jgi:hypothetical protein